ncbi:hypothetical protein LTV02_24710 [Nocardia yamanashiensis]|uniref:hypothetical protein n=1 Tax=Nocardia yamanashiensis TaxID=209247 RepID=UPI001E640BE3|nr:hypothetical protein [Nocardia yamanashiensis]UGT39268.1 hypothetical protein LTV02_24710 [Nocardia yamanashiensis]
MSTFSHRMGAAVTSVAAAAAVAVIAAPQAQATVDAVAISGAAPYKIDTEYTLTANLSGAGIGLLVYWTDNGEKLEPKAGQVPWPVGEASIKWKPATAGQHLITAAQGGSTKTITVNVVDPSVPGNPGTPGGGDSGSASKGLGSILGGLTGSAGS